MRRKTSHASPRYFPLSVSSIGSHFRARVRPSKLNQPDSRLTARSGWTFFRPYGARIGAERPHCKAIPTAGCVQVRPFATLSAARSPEPSPGEDDSGGANYGRARPTGRKDSQLAVMIFTEGALRIRRRDPWLCEPNRPFDRGRGKRAGDTNPKIQCTKTKTVKREISWFGKKSEAKNPREVFHILFTGKDRQPFMPFTCLPPIKGSVSCLTCGCGAHETFSMDGVIAAGFGSANVTKDSEQVYDEQDANYGRCELWTGADAEKAAAADPDHDWRISIFAPLYEAEYQRQGERHWVLVRKGDGFA